MDSDHSTIFPTLLNAKLSPNKNYVTVELPDGLWEFSNRILSMSQVSNIWTYCITILNNKNQVMFNSGEFTGITFLPISDGRRDTDKTRKFQVWAIHDSLRHHPRFSISNPSDEVSSKLRTIVITYLRQFPNLDITIEQFV